MELLRQLEHDQVRLWNQLQPLTSPMIEAKDCDPALLSGWTDRDISIWDISDSGGKPGLQRILVALCKRKKDWEKIGYVLFSREAVSSADLQLTQNNGRTGDSKIDMSNTHYEIRGITGKGLCTLIHAISKGTFQTGIFKKVEMEKLLYEAYERSFIKTAPRTATAEAQIAPVASGTQADSPTATSVTNLPPQSAANEEILPRSSADTTTRRE